MRLTPSLRAAALASIAAGCASYQEQPLLEQGILRELQAVRLEQLGPRAQTRKGSALGFDPSDGLSSDEAVAVALFLNPALRAARKERGVAEGDLIAAGLLPNPSLQLGALFLQTFTRGLDSSAFDLSLSWSPPRPGEIEAKERRARGRISEVEAQVAELEWRLAADVRKAHLTLWTAEERRRLFVAALGLRERIRALIKAKRAFGDASRVDENLVEIEYVEAGREVQEAANERERARLELNRLLGLPPRSDVRLEVRGDPLAPRTLALAATGFQGPVSSASLGGGDAMLALRPELKAARFEYEQAEQSLRLAFIRRIPWLSFGPSVVRDELAGKIENRFGASIGIELPIANLNQGEIAILEARREQLRAGYVAKLHQARAELNEALRSMDAQERLIRFFEGSIKPALDENAALTEANFARGEFNILQLITTQDKIQKARRQLIDTRLEYWRAVFDLERALGARVSADPK